MLEKDIDELSMTVDTYTEEMLLDSSSHLGDMCNDIPIKA